MTANWKQCRGGVFDAAQGRSAPPIYTREEIAAALCELDAKPEHYGGDGWVFRAQSGEVWARRFAGEWINVENSSLRQWDVLSLRAIAAAKEDI